MTSQYHEYDAQIEALFGELAVAIAIVVRGKGAACGKVYFFIAFHSARYGENNLFATIQARPCRRVLHFLDLVVQGLECRRSLTKTHKSERRADAAL